MFMILDSLPNVPETARATHARSSLLERREETDTGRAELSGWYAGSVRGARWRHWTLHCSIPGQAGHSWLLVKLYFYDQYLQFTFIGTQPVPSLVSGYS